MMVLRLIGIAQSTPKGLPSFSGYGMHSAHPLRRHGGLLCGRGVCITHTVAGWSKMLRRPGTCNEVCTRFLGPVISALCAHCHGRKKISHFTGRNDLLNSHRSTKDVNVVMKGFNRKRLWCAVAPCEFTTYDSG